MNILISMLLLLPILEAFVPVRMDGNFQDEQFLRDTKQEEEGSGEDVDIEDVLVSENSTSSTSTSSAPPTSSVSSSSHPTTHLIPTPAKPINCFDISKRCSKIKPLCTRDEYKHIMMRQCAKTCNFCPQFQNLPKSSRCRDSFHSCPIWARNGFCHSTYYTLEERKDFCRKSCQGC